MIFETKLNHLIMFKLVEPRLITSKDKGWERIKYGVRKLIKGIRGVRKLKDIMIGKA